VLGIILILIALIFAGQVVAGIRSGTTRIPMKILEFGEFERNENATNFWGIVGFNAVMTIALFGYGVALL
jgi:hypothetical protein